MGNEITTTNYNTTHGISTPGHSNDGENTASTSTHTAEVEDYEHYEYTDEFLTEAIQIENSHFSQLAGT